MSEDVSRRKALSLLGLGAVLGFTLSAALEPSEAEAQEATGTAPAAPAEATGTHGMQRRQGRRTHRHERRHGRHERRHERRTGEKPEATPPAGTAPAPQIGSQPLAGSHAPRLGVSAGLEPKRRLTTRGLIARQGRKQGALASTIASQHGNASPHKWGCGAEAGASAGAHRQRTWRESAEDWPEKAGAVAGPAAYRWRVAADRAGEVAQSATNAGRARS
jgi:hypothetical protein